jgi:hypothetical protein
LKTQSEGERREKGKEVGSTSIPFSHSPLIGYFNLLNSIGLNLNILFILPFCYFSSFYYVLDIGLYRANSSTTIVCRAYYSTMIIGTFGKIILLGMIFH